jgi:hypothetical protein
MNDNNIQVSKSQKVSILLHALKDAITDVLPDDDMFWENRREDVTEIYEYIDELLQINATK